MISKRRFDPFVSLFCLWRHPAFWVNAVAPVVLLALGSGCSTTRGQEDRAAAREQTELIVAERGRSDQAPTLPSAEAASQPAPKWLRRAEDEVAPGFSIKIASSSDRVVNGIFQVNEAGQLRLPYDVLVDAGGKSIKELAASIREGYRTFLVNPVIDVSIAKREYFVVAKGLVQRPGPVLVDANSSLDEIIGKAGGLAPTTSQGPSAQFAKIQQGNESVLINLNDYFSGAVTNIPEWQGGETIFFQSEGRPEAGGKALDKQFVHVLGEVKNPGDYPFVAGADFFDYLIRSGGPTSQADLSNVQVLRLKNNKRESIQFSAAKASSAPEIQPGDTIMLFADNPEGSQQKMQYYGTLAGILAALAMVATAAVAF